MHAEYRAPPALAAGARIALVAPAGPLASRADLERAESNVRTLGWQAVVGAHALDRDGYLAGDDAARLADLNAAIRDPAIDGVWCLRGGYGAMRILDGVDYDALANTPKALIGYSDITALHLAIRARCNLISYHGPTARAELTAFSERSLTIACTQRGNPFVDAPSLRSHGDGTASGPLEGGNLALICALLGTPYAPRLDGAILLLEDVNEPLYRIDRMLRQLMLAGALESLAALCFGSFTARGDDTDATPRSLDVLFDEVAARVRGPVVSGLPLGHIADQWTFPLGARATLSTTHGLSLDSL